IRIWHWGTVLLISGSLITVFIAKVILNRKNSILAIQDNLQKNNIRITSDQAKSLAGEFNDMIWKWHIYIGYVLAFLVLFRIIIEFIHPKNKKVIFLLKNSFKYLKINPLNKAETKHYILVRCIYILFYISITIQAITGLFMAYADGKKDLREFRHFASNIHSVFMWIIISFILIHIFGVLSAEIGKKYKGVVSDMINGGE
ncbi:MAG TPA: cytochrome b/b6 domain-containing protein, partial [Bacteroidia bacterium]|nr:cytochrome b/b6 domain-containing protein [Bacteroidia bacterium]